MFRIEPYERAGRSILRHGYVIHCWLPNGQTDEATCSDAAARPALLACIDALRSAATWRTTQDDAVLAIDHCMAEKGWTRPWIDGAILGM